MGIRVHKVAGWGATKFVPPADFDEKMECLYSISGEEFTAWLIENKEKIKELCAPKNDSTFQFNWAFMLDDVRKNNHISYAVSYDPEFGFKNRIVISPIEILKQCKRYDDLIDWLEEGHGRRWRWLKKGIYPYDFGQKPVSVVSICLFLGIENLVQNLREVLYVYWS